MDNLRIGILGAAYQCDDLLALTLKPWVDFFLKEFDATLTVISAQFVGYPAYESSRTNDKTIELLTETIGADNVIASNSPMTEADARSLAAKRLMAANCNYIWLWDADELYHPNEFVATVNYVRNNLDLVWFKINFKNLFGDGKRYVDGFCPPRIFKVHHKGVYFRGFYWDNDPIYTDAENKSICYRALAHRPVPRHVCHPMHYTWLNGERSRLKVQYQMSHFGDCSYRCDGEKIEINTEFYAKRGLPLPKVCEIP